MSSEFHELSGITWDHSRAWPPLVATAQRFGELHRNVRVRWEKRSLHDFGHSNVQQLADSFDLVVIDHPWAGFAINRGLFVDFRRHLDSDQSKAFQSAAVGRSLDSYFCHDFLFALPIDAASPAASYRPDLLDDRQVPQTWDEVIALATDHRVIMPCFHVDLLLHLVMLTATLSEKPLFDADDHWAETAVVIGAMDLLAALVEKLPVECFGWSPIDVYEQLSRCDDFAYCPFAYTYSNYARRGYAKHRLRFADLVELPTHGMLRAVLGGAGLAISARCRAIAPAVQYALYTASAGVQRGIYLEAGGQPAHREAWEDEQCNLLTDAFFTRTWNTISRAYLRPRYDGYVTFQETAGLALAAWLRGETTQRTAVQQLDAAYRLSRTRA